MKRWKRIVASLCAAALIAGAGAGGALAVGGPNEAGNSGHFKAKTNPCQGPNDQPNCPGKH